MIFLNAIRIRVDVFPLPVQPEPPVEFRTPSPEMSEIDGSLQPRSPTEINSPSQIQPPPFQSEAGTHACCKSCQEKSGGIMKVCSCVV